MSGGPHGPCRREFRSGSELETERLGAAFARAFEPASGQAIRASLTGDLGAGKTTFVRGLLRHFGVSGAVRSPTYSLVERYDLGTLEVIHGDLYRLESPLALAPLGLDEFDRPGALWFIEWPERAAAALPPPDLQLDFTVEPTLHRIAVAGLSARGAAWLQRVGSAEP